MTSMNSAETIREILGWCTVMNMGLLVVAAFAIMLVGGPMKQLHAKLYGLSEDDLSRAYFQYLAQYKIAIFIFNLAPYVALRIIE
jgi:undecaprenyl pyrophosphate synthase